MFQGFFRKISSNTIQLVVNQLFALLVFYFLSTELTKQNFGEFNWALSVLLTIFTILSFGADQIIVRKIATGESASKNFSLYSFHVIITGCLFYSGLLLIYFFLPDFFINQTIILFLAAGKLLLFFSTPFKQLATGLERFDLLMYMSVASNIVKGAGIALLVFFAQPSVFNIILIFVLGDLIELLICIIIAKKYIKVPFINKIAANNYRQVLKESIPQAGVVLFSSALARLDWILIGLFISAASLAEYSFAYKVFEMATLPLLVIAPLLVPFFSRQFSKGKKIFNEPGVLRLLKFEIIIASFIALMLNLLWTPLIDNITANKYGAVNANIIFILSLSMPILYLNNFLWSIHFAKGRTRMIFYIFAITFFINLIGNIILIPIFQNEGAAITYLFSVSLQTILYLLLLKEKPAIGTQALAVCSVCAFASGLVAKNLFSSSLIVIPLATFLYLILLLFTTQLRQQDWYVFKKAVLKG